MEIFQSQFKTEFKRSGYWFFKWLLVGTISDQNHPTKTIIFSKSIGGIARATKYLGLIPPMLNGQYTLLYFP